MLEVVLKCDQGNQGLHYGSQQIREGQARNDPSKEAIGKETGKQRY
jgi:hypothetical protein